MTMRPSMPLTVKPVRPRHGRPYSPLMMLLTVLSTLGVLYYGWFLWRPENRGDMLPWLLVITAESILVLHGLAAMWTILVGYRDRRDWTYYAT